MKVLMTADAVGGVWTYVCELCRALRPHGIEVILAVMGPTPAARQRESAGSLGNVCVVDRDWKLEWMEQPWDDVEHAGEWLLDLAHRERVDVVHLNGYAHAALEWPCPVLVVAHSCVCSWWQAVHLEPAPAEWNRYRAAVANGLNAADAVVAPTRAFLNTLNAIHGCRARGRVIHNAVDSTASGIRPRREDFVLACGRAWDEAKNLAVLDAAADSLSWRTYVAGQCMSPDGRTHHFRSLHVLDALPIEQVHAYMELAAIFAHPALYEPFGLAVLEAAQRGCALLLADIPTLRELWTDAAVFADPRNPESFREELQALSTQPRRREALARAAVERAAQFQPAHMGSEYRNVYRDLTSRRARKESAVA